MVNQFLCVVCEKVSERTSNHQKYCNNCLTKVCLNCGKQYKLRRIVGNRRRFCSRKCYLEYPRPTPKKGTLIRVRCKTCKKVFGYHQYKFTKPRVYCSHECHMIDSNKKRKGPIINHNNEIQRLYLEFEAQGLRCIPLTPIVPDLIVIDFQNKTVKSIEVEKGSATNKLNKYKKKNADKYYDDIIIKKY